MVGPARIEAMNASPHHSKVRVSLKLGDSLCVAGGSVTGKVEMECKTDRGLGIGVIMAELYAVEELTSRDHSATSTFLHVRRLFQGPGLPPSNAVYPHTDPGDNNLPPHYYHARRGTTSFLFRLPIPKSSPAAINFGSGLAQVRYEVRASVGIAWKGENRLVYDRKSVDVVESLQEHHPDSVTEGVAVGEGGKIWAQGRIIGGFLVAGRAGCIELQVKNLSTKKNTSLSVSLTRELYLPSQPAQKQPLQISDTLTSVSFRGPEYVIHPGGEGVANLVFDLPLNARGVKGGIRQGDDEKNRECEPLFEVRCAVNVKLIMGIGSKDIVLSIPVTVLDSRAAPILLEQDPQLVPIPSPQQYNVSVYDPMSAMLYHSPASPGPPLDRPLSPYGAYVPPMSPLMPYIDQGQVWLPPPVSPPYYPHHSPPLSPPMSPPLPHSYYYHLPVPLPLAIPHVPSPRPSSTEPLPSQPFYAMSSGLPPPSIQQPLLPLPTGLQHAQYTPEREEGKGERASRIALHLRMSSRHRSASPPAHRYSMPAVPEAHSSVVPDPLPIGNGHNPMHAIQHLPSQALAPPASNLPQALTDPSPSSSPQTQYRRPLTLNLSVSPAQSQGSVMSPRPMLSPKHSFSTDPFTMVTHVEQLERIAAEVDEAHSDMSISGGPQDLDRDVRDKTLPQLPTGTSRETLSPRHERVDALFPITAAQPEETPPTPTLAAVTSLKVPRCNALSPGGGLSGLDALEAKLLAEVGTRKVEKEARPDVRSVMPIAIPRPAAADDPANDSAISSLNLPGLDADARTLKLGQAGREREREQAYDMDEDDRRTTGWRNECERERDRESKGSKGSRKGGSSGTKKSKDKRVRKTADPVKDKEYQRLWKTAQGRVAAWLGSIEPDVPPQSATPPPVSPVIEQTNQRVNAWLCNLQSENANVPRSRSHSRSPAHSPAMIPVDLPQDGAGEKVNSWLSHLWAENDAPRSRSRSPARLPTREPEEPDSQVVACRTADREAAVHSPEIPLQLHAAPDVSAAPNPRSSGFVPLGTLNVNKPQPPKSSKEQQGSAAHQELAKVLRKPGISPRLAVFPPRPADSGVKYDIRSARGGRGGKVTAVAAVWASAAQHGIGKADVPQKSSVAKRVDVASPAPRAASVVRKPAPTALENSRKTTLPTPQPRPVTAPVRSPLKPSRTSQSPTEIPANAKLFSAADLTSKRARMIKSTSVPAMISSSLATPMLSSTASLARPAKKDDIKVTTLLAEDPPKTEAIKPGARDELAFGQARLRELIKRYQGQAA